MPRLTSRVLNLSDRELSRDIIEACRLGDRAAFRALYDHYKDRVYSIALHYFHGDSAAASDVTQQVFLKLIGSIGKFRAEAEFSTWLYRVVVNVCTDAVRWRKAQPLGADRVFLESHAGSASPEQEYARAEVASRVARAVSALPRKFRMAVLLRHFEDLSYEQIAEALNCSIGTAASRLSRGHRMLEERLRDMRRGKN